MIGSEAVSTVAIEKTNDVAVEARFSAALADLHRRTDRFFARLLFVQWLATIALALIVSPRTWTGPIAQTHFHVWAALLFGGTITLFPAWLGFRQSGAPTTRYVLAGAQMLMSTLLIHLTGGRIETHFHVFGSLAFLAFYRDVRVLAMATAIVYVDHVLRGWLWPESVYGVLVATPWRSVEHAFWVLFEVGFLTHSIRLGLREMREVAARQVSLEEVNRRQHAEVRESARELAGSEERFRALFQDSPIGSYRAKPSGELLTVNPAMLQILGYASPEEMHRIHAEEPGTHEQRGHRDFFRALDLADRVCRRDTMWRRHDGKLVHVRESARGFRDESGALAYVAGTVEDVTEQRQLQERYLQSQKVQAIGQLAGGIAHDFNNILTAITGYTEILNQQCPLGESERLYVGEIRKASDRAAALTQQLLAFSRKQTLQPRIIQLNAVVTDLDKMLQRLVGEHIRIRTITTPNLGPVKADPGQLQQVLVNLVVNARDAMPRGGNLTIETGNTVLDADYTRLHPEVLAGRYVMLAVSDDGVGMAPEVKARLFEPFFTTKEPGAGTGLGLATCHGIVRQSGGHITVYTELGHGTTFKIYLPLAEDAARPTDSTQPQVAAPRRGTETILLVEDERMVREMSNLMLGSFGYTVLAAANGLEALSIFDKNPYIEIVVTDVVMPDMGGRELVARMRQRRPQLRVLFTSGYTFDAIERTDLLEAGTRFLQKPYASAQLAEIVREMLDKPGTGKPVAG